MTPILDRFKKSYDIAIIICTEPEFEKKSLLLVRSIRQWSGRLRDLPIYSLSPRNLPVSEEIKSEFIYYHVHHKEKLLNIKSFDYGLANKPMVCHYFENILHENILVFLDSDQIILNEPTLFNLNPGTDIALRPVDLKNIGIENFEDIESTYWKKLYEISGKLAARKIKTTVCNTEIYEYYNSGMIVTRRKNRIFSAWKNNFERAIENLCLPAQGMYFLEQSVLAATISAKARKVDILDSSYNYPLHLHNKMRTSIRKKSMDELVSIHYHKQFDNSRWTANLIGLADFNIAGERIHWLIQNLNDLKL